MGEYLDSLEDFLTADCFTGEVTFKRFDIYKLYFENTDSKEDIAEFLMRKRNKARAKQFKPLTKKAKSNPLTKVKSKLPKYEEIKAPKVELETQKPVEARTIYDRIDLIYTPKERREMLKDFFNAYDAPIVRSMFDFINFVEKEDDISPEAFKTAFPRSYKRLSNRFELFHQPYKFAMKFFNEAYKDIFWPNKDLVAKYMY